MRKKYRTTIYTESGRSHTFIWSCEHHALIKEGNLYQEFKKLPYVKVKEGRTEVYVCMDAITEVSFTEKASKD